MMPPAPLPRHPLIPELENHGPSLPKGTPCNPHLSTNANTPHQAGIVGAGPMGTNLAILLTRHNITVSLFDTSSTTITSASTAIASPDVQKNIHLFTQDYHSFLTSVSTRPRLILSVPHGDAIDTVLTALTPLFKPGDIVLEAGNEFYQATERRQRELSAINVSLISCGIFGGVVGARNAPGMALSGDPAAIDKIMPKLEDDLSSIFKT